MTTAHRVPLHPSVRICSSSLRERANWWRSISEYSRFRYWMGTANETTTDEETTCRYS
jgi:hypothetical protein